MDMSSSQLPKARSRVGHCVPGGSQLQAAPHQRHGPLPGEKDSTHCHKLKGDVSVHRHITLPSPDFHSEIYFRISDVPITRLSKHYYSQIFFNYLII